MMLLFSAFENFEDMRIFTRHRERDGSKNDAEY